MSYNLYPIAIENIKDPLEYSPGRKWLHLSISVITKFKNRQ